VMSMRHLNWVLTWSRRNLGDEVGLGARGRWH
jgi:hypothetical protein